MPDEQVPQTIDHLALLVLDVQDTFVRVMPKKIELLKRVEFAVRAARLLGIRTLFTEQNPTRLGSTAPALLAGAGDETCFPKTGFSAFKARGVTDYLEENEIGHLLLAGLETPVCVYQTALDAHDTDIDVTLLSDCLGCRRPDDGQAALGALVRLGCHLLPSETVFYSLLGDASHPAFRDFNSLVKQFA